LYIHKNYSEILIFEENFQRFFTGLGADDLAVMGFNQLFVSVKAKV